MSKIDQKSPNRAIVRPLSSFAAALLCSGMILPALASAQSQVAVVNPQPMPSPDAIATQPSYPINSAISQWKSLTSAKGFSFASYASFLVAHPGWPGEMDLRKEAERALTADNVQPWLVTSYFRKHPPLSATSWLRFAEALSADNRPDEANGAARKAWTTGALTPEDEARFLSRYGSVILPGDHDTRMDKLLWQRSSQAAARQLGLTSSGKRAFFDARLAFITKAVDAGSKAELVETSLRNDPGYIADRNYWLRLAGDVEGARAYLGQQRRFNAPPGEPAIWLDLLEANAKGAASAGQWTHVYNIARQLEGAYAPGVLVRDRSLAERDSYTTIAWLGGTAAMDKLDRPGDAIRLFELYGEAARTAPTRAKGYFWAAQAAERAGRRDMANLHYGRAAEYFDQFHGQLASAKLGKPVRLPTAPAQIEISGGDRAGFDRNDLVRAMVALGAQGDHESQTRFVRTFAATVEGAANHALAEELAQRIDRPDLALLVGKSAREKGLPGYFRPSFPTIRVPDEHKGSWTMVHAIARQESQFDKEARSRVGARGLMQLMPGTARQTAPLAGVVYSPTTVTLPENNLRLGATYFAQMMDEFGGSYVLAVAAYNAGPGNARKFIRANGDPRLPGTDVLRWIEAIPLTETRGYVMRVLENAVVYDQINPQKQGRPGAPLAAFLGQQNWQAGSL